VIVGVGAVVVEAVIPTHEHALLYAVGSLQYVAYAGTMLELTIC
jgi:hypothetical protein